MMEEYSTLIDGFLEFPPTSQLMYMHNLVMKEVLDIDRILVFGMLI